MPSLRRSRRSPRLSGYLFSRRAISARQRKKIVLKRPQKLRLIRRYIRENKADPRTITKQPSFPNFHGPGRIGNLKPNRYPGKPFAYGPHDVVGSDKKVPISEINAIPNPIPDTGSVSLFSLPAGSPLLGAIRDTSTSGLIIPPTSLSRPFSKIPSGSFSALPPLPSFIPTITSDILIDTNDLSSPSSVSLPKSPSGNPRSSASKAHSINLAVIILLAVGSALLLLGSCVFIRICTRTRRKDLPKPSLPIFEDADPEDDFFESKESPIFGGKERLSPMPGPTNIAGPAWTWVQYPQSGTSAQRNSTGGSLTGPHPIQNHTLTDTSSKPPFVVPATSLQTPKRQSMGAASIYSPRSCANIAQAITHDCLAISNGEQILTRPRNRMSLKRASQLTRDQEQRHSTGSTIGLAYDGECIASPSVLEYTPVDTPVIGHREGRERIKSSYLATGSYPLSNTHGTVYSIATATRVNVGQRNSFSKDKFARQRDTQALTYALGLATPETHYLQSPQPTIYPEDSMSVVDIQKLKKRSLIDRKPSQSVPDIPVIIPDQLSQNPGLMNMDFRMSQMSLSEVGMDDGALSLLETPELKNRSMSRPQSSSNTGLPSSSNGLDMPPRVPSPPPLPSLSQMALAQQNPEAYANYRSPTYSLYGLYESSNRRSIAR